MMKCNSTRLHSAWSHITHLSQLCFVHWQNHVRYLKTTHTHTHTHTHASTHFRGVAHLKLQVLGINGVLIDLAFGYCTNHLSLQTNISCFTIHTMAIHATIPPLWIRSTYHTAQIKTGRQICSPRELILTETHPGISRNLSPVYQFSVRAHTHTHTHTHTYTEQ